LSLGTEGFTVVGGLTDVIGVIGWRFVDASGNGASAMLAKCLDCSGLDSLELFGGVCRGSILLLVGLFLIDDVAVAVVVVIVVVMDEWSE
jgi:hypothetical protein